MTETPGEAYPRPGYAWFVVFLLMLSFTLSLIDRNIMGLVITPIKAQMALSDLQVGLLLGAAFALFYVTMGIPMGVLADRVNRRKLIATGIILWSIATVACGLGDDFGTLFAARLAVGFGEAALVPAAVSLIGDYFPKERRSRAVSLFWSGALLGTGVAFLVGGPLVEYVEGLGTRELPLVGGTEPWQMVFMIVGAPGMLLGAAVLLAVREPPRRERAAPGNQSVFAAAAYVYANRRVYFPLFAGMASVFVLGYSALWTAPMFERTWGWSIAAIGIANGILIFVAAIPGTTTTGWLADRLRGKGHLDGPLRCAILGAAVLLPGYVLYPLMGSGELALGLLFFALFGQAMASAAGPAAILNVAPGELRGQVTALYLLVTNASGLLLGPAMVGGLTDFLGGGQSLRYSLTIVALVMGLLAVALLASGRKAYAELAAKG